jgi:hypothetical protein
VALFDRRHEREPGHVDGAVAPVLNDTTPPDCWTSDDVERATQDANVHADVAHVDDLRCRG